MSDAVILALIGAFVSTIASAIAAWVTIMNGRKVDTVTAKVEEVHKATNGLTEKLKEAASAAGHATGHAQGMQDQKTAEAVRENGRMEGVRDEKLRRVEAGQGLSAAASVTDPVPVKVVAAVPVPVKETPDKT